MLAIYRDFIGHRGGESIWTNTSRSVVIKATFPIISSPAPEMRQWPCSWCIKARACVRVFLTPPSYTWGKLHLSLININTHKSVVYILVASFQWILLVTKSYKLSPSGAIKQWWFMFWSWLALVSVFNNKIKKKYWQSYFLKRPFESKVWHTGGILVKTFMQC